MSKSKQSKTFEFYKLDISSEQTFGYYVTQVPAGFPSPADDFLEKRLDLNDYLIKNKSATFLVKVSGNSMIDAGIHDGDIIVVDRSITAVEGKIILGVLNGEFTVKKLIKTGKKVFLEPANEQFKKIEITAETDFRIWGVVTYAIHRV